MSFIDWVHYLLYKIKTAGNHTDYLQSINTICTTRTW